MTHLITFSDDKMSISAARLVDSAYRYGVDSCTSYTPTNLDPHFMLNTREMWEEQTRLAWYVWKPYVVLDAILKLNVNDVLIYCDAGNELVGNVGDIIGRMDDSIFLFGNGRKHAEWTKADVLFAINHAKMSSTPTFNGDLVTMPDDFIEAEQVQASTIFFRVCDRSIRFIREWYAWSMMPGLIDNSPSIIPNVPTFAEHRWDQSILGSLQIKWKLPLHWFPSLTNFHNRHRYGDTYQAILNHHRKRNNEW